MQAVGRSEILVDASIVRTHCSRMCSLCNVAAVLTRCKCGQTGVETGNDQMLIVAIPKSASSSLVRTVGEATGLDRGNPQVRRKHLLAAPVPDDYAQLARFHSEVAELTSDIVTEISGGGRIYKHHIVPTSNNLALLRDVPKIILLRPADEIVDAYWRGFSSGTWTTTVADIAGCKTLEEWREKSMRIGLTGELENFNRRWQSHSGNAKLISYADLVNNTQETVRSVLSYWGLDVDNVPQLARVNYSRDGGMSTPKHKLLLFKLKKLVAQIAGR